MTWPFGPERYAPESDVGLWLSVHRVTHTALGL